MCVNNVINSDYVNYLAPNVNGLWVNKIKLWKCSGLIQN